MPMCRLQNTVLEIGMKNNLSKDEFEELQFALDDVKNEIKILKARLKNQLSR